jgi:transposase-like protein
VSDAPFLGWRYRWLRFYREDGSLVPTREEIAEAERQRAEAERQRAEQAERRLAELEAELRRLRGEL